MHHESGAINARMQRLCACCGVHVPGNSAWRARSSSAVRLAAASFVCASAAVATANVKISAAHFLIVKASNYFLAATGAAAGGASAFHVSRMYIHLPFTLRDTDRNLPDSMTAPLIVAV